MSKKWYIEHEDIESPNEDGSPNIALFGPFKDDHEVTVAINDAYADLLAASGDLDAVELTDEEASKMCINSADWWFEQSKDDE